MGVLLGAVIASSLVGSLHCVGMCGGFVAFYSAGATGSARQFAHFAYHAGRLTSYVIAGAVAGLVGGAIDLAGSFAGVSRVAAIIAGACLLLWGVGALLPRRAYSVFRPTTPASWKRFTARIIARARDAGPAPRAATIGLLSTLLPCGWLYAFVLTAAGTGSAATGAMVMLAFWIGSVPALLVLGEGVHRLAAPIRARVPVLSAVALVVIGLGQISGRLTPMDFSTIEPASAALSLEEQVKRVDELDSATLPCCAESESSDD